MLLVAAFLAGGIPFAYLAVRLVYQTDVREHGSGNAGATNAARMFPKRWQLIAFLVIFLLDAGKGYAAAGLLPRLWDLPEYAPALAAAFAVFGHTFSPVLHFRGGKGMATTLGALLALEPLATGVGILAFFLIYLPTRIVAAGSITAAVVLPLAVFVHGTAPPAVRLLAILLSALIIVRHRSNISKMLRGKET